MLHLEVKSVLLLNPLFVYFVITGRLNNLFIFIQYKILSSSEIQTIVLKSIASIADKHKQIFEPYLKSFYVHSNDSRHVKCYKLEILTILANGSNISTILREFQVKKTFGIPH